MQEEQENNQNTIAVAVAIGILSLVVRLWGLASKGLWYDELQSVTHAILPLRELLKSVDAFDPHPPFYYLQLHWWLLCGVTDVWIKLNSILWSVLTTILLFIASKKIFNLKVAVIAALLFAISPFSVVQSQDARMYSLLMFFGLLSFIFTHQFLSSTKIALPAIGIIISTEIFLYSHGAGFMLLVSLFTYVTTSFLGGSVKKRARFVQWCCLLCVILALYAPWLRSAYWIELRHLLVPELETITDTLYVLLFGFTADGNPEWLQWSLMLLMVTAIGITIVHKTSREISLSFIIVPVFFCAAVSYLYRPIWMYRTLAYLSPFLCLAVALGISKLRASRNGVTSLLGNVFSLITVFSFMAALAFQQLTFQNSWNVKEAVNYVQSEIQSGDVVYVKRPRLFWGWLWYLTGPGSVNPLTTDYSITTQQGIQVFSKPAIDKHELGKAQNYWLVEFDIKGSSSSRSFSPDTTRNFNGLYVTYVRSNAAH